MTHLPKLRGPNKSEAEIIRTNLLRFLEHAYTPLVTCPVRRKARRVIDYVEARQNTGWFLRRKTLTSECASALNAVIRIGKEANLF